MTFSKKAPVAGKPDNSPEFFSARRPDSRVLSLQFNSTFPKQIEHPWRYFVAAGESLAKIEQFLAESKTVAADKNALAKSVGAECYDPTKGFIFANADVEATPRVLMSMKGTDAFICDSARLGAFFPNVYTDRGFALKERISEIEKLPPAEVQAARDALAKEFRAESFGGKFFTFKDWESRLELATISFPSKFRLKSNPAFVQAYGNGFSPDRDTDEGFRVAKAIIELDTHYYPEQRFHDWLETFALDISYYRSEGKPKPAELEKIGDEWIIKVPVTIEGIFGADGMGGERTGEKEGWVLPPGATPIAISEYYAKLEQSGSLRSLPVVPPKP